MYVLASRVRTRRGLRVLAASDWTHLKKLTHPPELEIWDRAYEGVGSGPKLFSQKLAAEAALELAERLQKAHAEKKRAEPAVPTRKQPASKAARSVPGNKVQV